MLIVNFNAVEIPALFLQDNFFPYFRKAHGPRCYQVKLSSRCLIKGMPSKLEFILVICWHSSVNGSVLLTEFSWFMWNGFKPIFVLQEEPHKGNLISLDTPGMNKDDTYMVWQGTSISSRFPAFPKDPKGNFIILPLGQYPSMSLHKHFIPTILLMWFLEMVWNQDLSWECQTLKCCFFLTLLTIRSIFTKGQKKDLSFKTRP